MPFADMMQFKLIKADPSHHSVFCRLWQFYQYHQSAFDGEDLDEHGRFDVDEDFLQAVLRGEEGCDVYLIAVQQKIAGFATIETTEITAQKMPELADLFILPKYRKKGIARSVIEQLMLQQSQQWHVAIDEADQLAHGFWEQLFVQMKIAGKVLSVSKVKPAETEGFSEFIVTNV
jgi:predicted acetyltransferase